MYFRVWFGNFHLIIFCFQKFPGSSQTLVYGVILPTSGKKSPTWLLTRITSNLQFNVWEMNSILVSRVREWEHSSLPGHLNTYWSVITPDVAISFSRFASVYFPKPETLWIWNRGPWSAAGAMNISLLHLTSYWYMEVFFLNNQPCYFQPFPPHFLSFLNCESCHLQGTAMFLTPLRDLNRLLSFAYSSPKFLHIPTKVLNLLKLPSVSVTKYEPTLWQNMIKYQWWLISFV